MINILAGKCLLENAYVIFESREICAFISFAFQTALTEVYLNQMIFTWILVCSSSIMNLQECQENWFHPSQAMKWLLKNISQNKEEICMKGFQETQVCKIVNSITRILSIVSNKKYLLVTLEKPIFIVIA